MFFFLFFNHVFSQCLTAALFRLQSVDTLTLWTLVGQQQLNKSRCWRKRLILLRARSERFTNETISRRCREEEKYKIKLQTFKSEVNIVLKH